MTTAFAAKLHLPPQDLDAPTLFAPTGEAIRQWLETLPKANLGQTTRALYHAVTELNRVRLNPLLRPQLLEVLRPSIHFAGAGLCRHYLNQPLQLPEQAQKVARLAHVLHEQLAIGYTLTAVQTAALNRGGNQTQQQGAIATAVHRAMVEHSRNLLRDYVLYRDPHPGCWFTLHQLARFARDQRLPDRVIADSQCGDSGIEQTYLRALLLGGARCNQLRQDNIQLVFELALRWAAAASLGDFEHCALVIDENSDDGPIYREYADRGDGGSWRGIGTAFLTRELAAQRQRSEVDAAAEGQPTAELLTHLIQAWSSPGAREFLRSAVDEPVEIAIGLTATHHFVSGGVDLHLLLGTAAQSKLALETENPFLQRRPPAAAATALRDVWDSPYAPQAGVVNVSLEILEYEMREQQQRASAVKEREKFRSEAAKRINISPGGLCVTWPPHSKMLLRTGEIVGIRDGAQQRWNIGVIRWGRITEEGPRLGIELLGPSALPYGARVINKAGPQSEYQRVLVLPEVRQVGQPTTLIAPRLPFRVGQKVALMHRGKETRVQLTRKFASTASFNQFEFRRLSSVQAEAAPSATAGQDGGFDNLWDSL